MYLFLSNKFSTPDTDLGSELFNWMMFYLTENQTNKQIIDLEKRYEKYFKIMHIILESRPKN